MEKAYLQVYTGDGKGKTTAALGLGLRAVGSGLKVIMYQFLKGVHSGELNSVPSLGDRFSIVRLGKREKFFWHLDDKEKEALKNELQSELEQVRAALSESACDIIILDEIFGALHANLLTLEDLMGLIDSRPPGMEMILTGRGAPAAVIKKADLVTEMLCIKHYFSNGVPARNGIEK